MSDSGVSEFIKTVQGSSVDRLFDFSRVIETLIKIETKASEVDTKKKALSSSIEVVSENATIQFRVFYALSTVKLLTNSENDNEDYLLSFMNEYCNVIGGCVTRLMQQSGNDGKISLPKQESFDGKIEHEPQATENRSLVWWRIRVEDESIIVRFKVDYNQDFQISNVEEIDEPEDIFEFF